MRVVTSLEEIYHLEVRKKVNLLTGKTRSERGQDQPAAIRVFDGFTASVDDQVA